MSDYVAGAYKKNEEIKKYISFLKFDKNKFMRSIEVDYKNKIIYVFTDEIEFEEININTDEFTFVLDKNKLKV